MIQKQGKKSQKTEHSPSREKNIMQIYEKKGNSCRFAKKDITVPLKIGREMFVRLRNPHGRTTCQKRENRKILNLCRYSHRKTMFFEKCDNSLIILGKFV